MKQTDGYFAEHKQYFLHALKSAKSNILWIFTSYLGFAGITVLLGLIARELLLRWQVPLSALDTQTLAQGTVDQLENAATLLRNFLVFGIVMIVFLVILMIINWSLFQGLINNKLAGKMQTLTFLFKFCGLNLIWMGIWIIIFGIAYYGSNQSVTGGAIFLLWLLFVYLTNILYIEYTKHGKLVYVLKVFKIGVDHLYLLVAPLLLVFGGFFALKYLFSLITPFSVWFGIVLIVVYWAIIVMLVSYFQIYTEVILRKEKDLNKQI
ncbi:MAG: hypothetical protein KJ601_05625 [Nanoarchaeota archaeon]|nr:hypothetical protein [Nanoarchaeota archaeon]